MSSGGSGADAWYVFEPVEPRPRSAPLAIVMHGYYEFSGYASMYELIRHTVRKGNVVIYPRWQTGIATPCPGPFDIEPCMTSAVNGIRGALVVPAGATPSRVQPQLGRRATSASRSAASSPPTSPTGTGRSTCRSRGRSSSTTRTTAASNGVGEPALDDSLAGIPSSVKLQCHSGADGVIVRAGQGGHELQRDLPEARAHPGARTRTSC